MPTGTSCSPSCSPSRSFSLHSCSHSCSYSPFPRMQIPSWHKSRTPSLIRHGGQHNYISPIMMSPPLPPPPPPPPLMHCMSPPLFPPPIMWPPSVMKCPIDILTFHYNKNMAYAPAAKTYDICPHSDLYFSVPSDTIFFCRRPST
jgi:hypothetical protein